MWQGYNTALLFFFIKTLPSFIQSKENIYQREAIANQYLFKLSKPRQIIFHVCSGKTETRMDNSSITCFEQLLILVVILMNLFLFCNSILFLIS